LLLQLRAQGVEFAYATLHVGLDTFAPVKEEDAAEHQIHSEWCSLSPDTARQINQARLGGRRVVAVGTTSVRILETAARASVRQAQAETGADVEACPWRPVVAYEGPTDLFILPGHRFRIVDALLTNFHLPRSTLLMLVSALAGRETMLQVYAEAVRERYRFYSFGDAMLIL
jgi:S-adenosylmethionine:tRNA ribosyltransferase-isomerase